MSRGERGRTAWGFGRVAFLANLEQFKEDVSKGWPLSYIYKTHEKSLGGLSYKQFAHYMHKYIHPAVPKPAERMPKPKKEKPVSEIKPKRFVPGPKVPNPADLI